MQTIQEVITTVEPPQHSKGEDTYRWRKSDGSFGPIFSSRVTWEYLRQPSPAVFWSKAVWFKENIPRNSFMAWFALLRRLPTKDRLLSWGLNVTEGCVLCSTGLETHHHLFFECEFSSSLWLGFASQVWDNPPSDLHAAAAWILQSHYPINPNATILIKLIFQSVIYILWRERNARIFTSSPSTRQALHLQLDRLLRDRILSIPARSQAGQSLLQFYFYCYRPP